MAGINIGGVAREALVAGAGVNVGGVVREILGSTVVVDGITIGAVVREVLALYLPASTQTGAAGWTVVPDAYGPIPVNNAPA